MKFMNRNFVVETFYSLQTLNDKHFTAFTDTYGKTNAGLKKVIISDPRFP